MYNSAFGKMQENLRNYVCVKLITNARMLCRQVAKMIFSGLSSARVVESAHV